MSQLSARNPRVQQLRRLLGRRRARDQSGQFVIEGASLLREALAAGHVPDEVFVAADVPIDDELIEAARQGGATVHEVAPEVIESVGSTVAPQPLLSVVRHVDTELDAAVTASATFVVVAARVRDPGNGGTLVRTAAAAGADAVVFCDDSVDLFNPKVVRASAGALFRIPVVRSAPIAAVWDVLSRYGLRPVGLAGGAGNVAYDKLNLLEPVAIVAGNEAEGLDPAVRERVDVLAAIPMAAGVESINVAAALAAVCFEVARQRRGVRG